METGRTTRGFARGTVLGGGIALVAGVSPVVALVADLNNYLLPLWMLVFGGWLIWFSRTPRIEAA